LRSLRLGSRGSRLALIQSQSVAARLEQVGCRVELVVIATAGDRRRPDEELGEGIFVGAIEVALGAQEIDLAVHSAKDLPMAGTPGLVVGAYPERGDPRDALVSAGGGTTLAGLRVGAEIGTDSPRRRAFLLRQRPDLRLVPCAGNVDTRLGRLNSGSPEAAILAAAGLDRLGQGGRADQRLDPEIMPPAPAQGALAVQCRAQDDELTALLAGLDQRAVRLAVVAERAVLAELDAGCSSPVGALAHVDADTLFLVAAAIGEGGAHSVRLRGPASLESAEELGRTAARSLAERAGLIR